MSGDESGFSMSAPDKRVRRASRRAGHAWWGACLALALLGAAGAARAQTPEPAPAEPPAPPALPVLLQAGGDLTALAPFGDRLLLGQGPRVLILEPGQDGAPRLIGQSEVLGGLVTDIAVDGQRAYAVTSGYAPETDNALTVLDLADPTHPVVLGRLVEPWLSDVFALDGLVYVTAARSFLIVDFKDPALPVKLGSAYVLPADILVRGKLAYLPAFDGMRILDVSDPLLPVQVGHWVTAANTYDVVLRGDVAFVTGSELLHVVDVSNPAAPTLITELPLPSGALDLDLADDLLLASFGGGEGLHLLDVADPTAPHELATLELPGDPRFIRILGDRAFVSCAEGGLRVVDLSRPQQPRELAPWSMVPPPVDLRLAGDRALVWSYAQARLVDLKPASMGALLGGWAPDSRFAPAITAVDLADGRAYAVHGDKLSVLDLGDPQQPRLLAEARLDAPVSALVVQRGLAYLADEASLTILSLADPARPRKLGEMRGDWSARDLALAGGRLYIAGGEPGLAVLDVMDPAHPFLVASLTVPGAIKVELSGARVYVAAQGGGLGIWTQAPGGDLRALPALPTVRPLMDVAVAGSTAYLLTEDAVLSAVDLRDSAAPVLLGVVDLPGTGAALRVMGDRAYVAAAGGGLNVVGVPRGLPALHLPWLGR